MCFSGPAGARDNIPSSVEDGRARPWGGLWEPEFTTGKNGELIILFSDKWKDGNLTRQKLVEKKFAADGTWGLPTAVQPSITRGAPTDPGGQNPGMIIVRRMPSGKYFMVYELCGRPDNVPAGEPLSCSVHSRTSADGWTWTSRSDQDPNPRKRLGDLVSSQGGRHFRTAPGLAWVRTSHPDGALVLVGKAAFESGNVPAKDGDGNDVSGRTIMISPQDGSGKWYEIGAPVEVPHPWGDGTPDACRIYSSALLPSADGQSFLAFAGDIRPSDVEPQGRPGQ